MGAVSRAFRCDPGTSFTKTLTARSSIALFISLTFKHFILSYTFVKRQMFIATFFIKSHLQLIVYRELQLFNISAVMPLQYDEMPWYHQIQEFNVVD